ncbi:WG repeat-containing protein [uncultured Fusobacterium sp.]|uniref:WG repeat-containing protein n=1 Tax=uncultured Fusobacterium sp. TaxID=159267 RepID=UPI002803B870|nr:WG repeat-containing protein [uncultured Fusobacterium sp.]
MKKILLLFLLLLSIISCGKKEVLFSELQHRNDGLYYEKNQNKPFSGIVLTKYEDGQIEEKAKMVKGVLHGEFSLYTENGDLRIKGKYINGFLDNESNYLIALEEFQNLKEGDKDIKKINNLLFNHYPDKYDNVWQPKEGLARAKKDGKYGYIDDNGKVIIPFEYEYAEDFNEGLAIVWKGYKLLVDDYFKCGYIDKTGKEVISIKYDDVEKFKNGIAKVTENRESFFINKMGEISFKYDKANDFSEGLAAVEKAGKWGYIDRTRKEVIPFKYDEANDFSEGLAAIEKNGKYGYIDKTGKVIIPFKYDRANDFSEGLAAIEKDRKWGYIDKIGKVIIPFEYDEANDFSEGLAVIEKDRKWGYIDKIGKIQFYIDIYDPSYNSVGFMGKFNEGLAYLDYDFGSHRIISNCYINKNGEEVIDLFADNIFPTCSSFNEGLAIVLKHDKWGYIDKTGKIVIPFEYDKANDFSGGLAAVEKNGKWGYIDRTGKIVIPFEYDKANDFSEGLAAVEKNGKWDYLNKPEE